MPSEITSVLSGMIPMYVNMLGTHMIGVEMIPEEIREACVASYQERYAAVIEAEKEQASVIKAEPVTQVTVKKRTTKKSST